MDRITLRRRFLPAALLITLALCAALATASVAAAQGKRCHPGGYAVDAWQVSDGSAAAGAPATDGDLIVWADDRDGDADVYAYDLLTGEETVVRAAPGDQTDPVVAGGQVYWIDRSEAAPVLWTADPDTGAAAPVSGPGADQPAASPRFVVWSQATLTGRDILALDRESDAVVTVCAAAGDQVRPAASEDHVAWEDYRNGSAADIYAWDAARDQEVPVCVADGDQTAPSVYGSVVLWADARSGGSDIYGADIDEVWLRWAERQKAPARGCEASALEFVVAAGCGDQQDPVISGPMAYWTDFGGCDELGDIAGKDLTMGGPFVVAGGCGAQTDAAAGDDGGVVAWLDSSGDLPVVYGARVAWAEGDDGGSDPGALPEWTTEDIVTLFLGVLADLDLFDEVRFAVDDGDFGEWQPLNGTEAVQLPAADGRHEIHLQLADSVLGPDEPGSEEQPFEITVTTTLDRRGPVTTVRGVRVRRGAIAKLRFRVRDGLSSSAAVTLRIKNRAGKVVKLVDAGSRATNRLNTRRVKANLKRGRYTVQVLARDLAGNTQRAARAGILVVR